MPREFIPVASLNENTPTDGRGVNEAYIDVGRFRNVDFRTDGDGNITASARQKFNKSQSDSVDDATSSRGRGLYQFDAYNILVDEDTYYYNGGSTTITGGNSFYAEYLASFAFHNVTGVQNLVLVNAGHTSTNASANHGNVWYAASGSSAPTRVTDADMPGNNGVSLTRGGASLNGYFFVCDITGKIHNSNINDITAWTATDFITAEREPDVGIYLGKHRDHIVYIGTQSIEFFYDAGNATGSPLARRQDISYRIGCIHPNSVVELNNRIYFVGVDQYGVLGVFEIDNFQVNRISNSFLERGLFTQTPTLLAPLTTLETTEPAIFMSFYESPQAGRCLALTVRVLQTYVLNIKLGIWTSADTNNNWTYKGLIGLTTSVLPIVSTNFPKNDRVLFTNGAVATFASASDTGITDLAESTSALSYIYSMPWNGGTRAKKRFNSVNVMHYPHGSVTTTPYFSIGWQDTDKVGVLGYPDTNVTNERQLDLSVSGNDHLTRCGTARQRIFKMQFDDSGLTAVLGLEVFYEIVE